MVLNAQRRAEAFYAAQRIRRRGRDLPGRRDRARPDDEGALSGGRQAARDPHRPAHRAADDPRPGAGPTGPTTSAALARARPRGGRELPFCEGREDRTPPEVYADRPGGGEPDTPGWTDARRAQPLPGAGADARRTIRPTAAAGRRRGRRCRQRGDPLLRLARAGEPDLFSSRPATRGPRGDRQRAAARDRDGRARRRASSPRRWPPGASGCAPTPRRRLRAADRQRGRRRRRLARAQPRPALRAPLRPGGGRARARAGRRLRRTHRGRRPARRHPRRGGAPRASAWSRSTTRRR